MTRGTLPAGIMARIPLYKVVLAGDLGVGKTSIFQRYDIDKFFDYKDSDIGLDKLNKTVTIEGQQCKINLWDTAGMERTRSLTSNYYHGSHAVVFVYAIDDRYSLNVLTSWIEDAEKDAKGSLKFLVGNKIDLKDEGLKVEMPVAQSFFKNNHLDGLFQVSAKTGEGITEMFEAILKMLLDKKKATVQQQDAFTIVRSDEMETQGIKKGCGC